MGHKKFPRFLIVAVIVVLIALVVASILLIGKIVKKVIIKTQR